MGASDCDKYKHCQSIKNDQDLCLIDPDFDPLGIEKYGYTYIKCLGKKVFYISKNSDFELVKNWATENCVKFKSMVFNTHGTPTRMTTGDLSINNLGKLSELKCLFQKDAKIELDGCFVGKGCQGQIFMQQVATAILSEKGKIVAPTALSAGLLVTPHFSVNGRHRTLVYDPVTKSESWDYSGVSYGEKNAVKVCYDEAYDLLSEIEKLNSTHQCPKLSADILQGLRREINQLKDSQTLAEAGKILNSETKSFGAVKMGMFETTAIPTSTMRNPDLIKELQFHLSYLKGCKNGKLLPHSGIGEK
jgi:hypothetical protein